MADPQVSVAGIFQMSLDGAKDAALIKSIEGGNLKAKKISEHGGPTLLKKHKHGNVEYSDVKVTLNLAMAQDWLDWAALFLKAEPVSKTGVAFACNIKYEAMAEREYQGMWISSVKFNDFDADKDESFYVDIECVIDRCMHRKGSGKKVSGTMGGNQRLWSASAFDLEIGSLPCGFVSKVAIPACKQKFTKARTGKLRSYENVPGTVDIDGELSVTMPMARGYNEWSAYAESYLALGNMGNDTMLTGALTMYAQDQKTQVATIEFQGLSLTSLDVNKMEGGSEKIQTFDCKLAVEEMVIKPLIKKD